MVLASATVISCWQSAWVMGGSAVSVGFAVGFAVVAVALPLAGVPDAADVPPGLHAATKRQRQARRARVMRDCERFMSFIGFMA
jgi:hypothetical protein